MLLRHVPFDFGGILSSIRFHAAVLEQLGDIDILEGSIGRFDNSFEVAFLLTLESLESRDVDGQVVWVFRTQLLIQLSASGRVIT